MGNNYTDTQYKGTVKLSLKKNGKILPFSSGHNGGTETLSRAFAMFMAGNYEASNLIPKFIDIRHRYPEAVYGVTRWDSCLAKEVALSAPSYYLDTSLQTPNWVMVVTATIPYSMLLNSYKPFDPESVDDFRLSLLADINSDPLIDRELAYFGSDDLKTYLAKLQDGTQAIIEWKMQLIPDTEESN